jgi:L-seryl-tRNA(Ser) seleniumtransferase
MSARPPSDSTGRANARLRELPAVDQLAAQLRERSDNGTPSLLEASAAARAVLSERRAELIAGASGHVDLLARARAHLRGSLRGVLNGTGVVLHTNLGRAPLPQIAADALNATARGYLNLELDLSSGRRGHRDAHLTATLRELTGAEDGLAVNNGAAAVMLAAAALAGPERSIAVSRGQLVEIGGGFRIPDVIAHSGSRLIEIGTTNRTRLEDYRAALDAGADVILRVHPSNFRTVGYVEDVEIDDLCTLGVPVIDDIGSGVLADELPALADEPSVKRAVRAGAALVCFSGDKLLGGPQAGILVGSAAAVEACRRHPLTRALRIGRLPLTALAATLSLYRDPERALRELPVLAMLAVDQATLRARAERLAKQTGARIIDTVSKVGGGALPLLELHGPAVALQSRIDPSRLSAVLRAGDPPLLTRITDGQVMIDPRTLTDDEIDLAATVVRTAFASAS